MVNCVTTAFGSVNVRPATLKHPATLNGASVTGVAGFSFSQSGQVITISVRDLSNEPRLNVGDSYVVSYTLPVLSTLKAASLTIPNSAELASYATTATTIASTESYVDIRCGEVRLETSADHPECSVSDLTQPLESIQARLLRMRRGVTKALALRKQYVRAGYCKAADNGCIVCGPDKSRCLNTCRTPSAAQDQAIADRAQRLYRRGADTVDGSLFKQAWTLVCSSYMTCELEDVTTPKSVIEDAGQKMADDMRAILDSCCMRTNRARAALRQSRASLKQAARLDAKRLSASMEQFPNPGLLCQ